MPKYLWYWAPICPLDEVGRPLCAHTASSRQTLEAKCFYRLKHSDFKTLPQTGTVIVVYQRAGLWGSFDMPSGKTGKAFGFKKLGLSSLVSVPLRMPPGLPGGPLQEGEVLVEGE
jgi:hypothetical protein